MMVAFIDEHRLGLGVEPICGVLPIAPSTYYSNKACAKDPAKRSARRKRDEVLKERIRTVWDDNYKVYGVLKVWHQLLREGTTVARFTVERLMRQMGLLGVVKGRTKRTAVASDHEKWPSL